MGSAHASLLSSEYFVTETPLKSPCSRHALLRIRHSLIPPTPPEQLSVFSYRPSFFSYFIRKTGVVSRKDHIMPQGKRAGNIPGEAVQGICSCQNGLPVLNLIIADCPRRLFSGFCGRSQPEALPQNTLPAAGSLWCIPLEMAAPRIRQPADLSGPALSRPSPGLLLSFSTMSEANPRGCCPVFSHRKWTTV